MRRKMKNINALLMIPKRNKNIAWEKKDDIITINIIRNKKIDKIMHKIFKTPLNVKIELDELGSFVWEKCDGMRNINDISKEMTEYFGKRVQPVNKRLLKYLNILYDNKFIHWGRNFR